MKAHIALLLTTGALTMPAAAIANDSATDAYGGQGNIITSIAGGGTTGGSGNVVSGTSAPTVAGATATRPAANVAATAPVASTTAPEAVSDSSLPFTGLDLSLMALGGIVLLGLGLAMRRVAGRTHAA